MPSDALVDALADYTDELDAADAELSLPDWLRDRLATATVVGLGEATHGTHEFARLKHQFLQYLATETDLDALCLEAGFAETLALDQYVTDGEGTAREALESLRGWSWAVEEVHSLVEWLREVNADRPRAERIRLSGLDAQYTETAVAELRSFLQRVDLDQFDAIREDLRQVDDGGTLTRSGPGHSQLVDAADRIVEALRTCFRANRARYVAATSAEQFRIASRCIDHIEHAVAFKDAVRALRGGVTDAEATARCLRRRDRAMASTVEWARERHPRVAIWAHNAHITRSGQSAADGAVQVPSLGSRLADHSADGYLSVGFALGRGTFRAVTEIVEPSEPRHVRRLERHTRDSPAEGSIEAALAAVGYPVCALDVRAARADDRLTAWLADAREQFSVGATYDGSSAESPTKYAPGEAFDVLCYADRTTATQPLA